MLDNLQKPSSASIIQTHELEPAGTPTFYFYLGICLFLTAMAGVMSGLTVGYLSINKIDIDVKTALGTAEEKKTADNVLQLLLNHHHLLVTLLLMNAIAMESLPIFLDKIVPTFWAILISVTIVLVFGEIVPQAICTGPSQLKIAEKCIPLTKFLMYSTYPITKPMAVLLDLWLGKHGRTRFGNRNLQ